MAKSEKDSSHFSDPPTPEDLAEMAERIREKPRAGDLDGLIYSLDDGETWERLEDKI